MENIKNIFILTAGLLLTIIIVFCSIYWNQSINKLPKQPSLSINGNDSSQISKLKEITNFKELTSVIQAQQDKTFDLIITKTLLPLLNSIIAAIITYILAKASFNLYTSYLDYRNKNKVK